MNTQQKINPSFSAFATQRGLLYDYSENKFPTKLHSFHGPEAVHFDSEDSTFYGFVHESVSSINIPAFNGEPQRHIVLASGEYFSINKPFYIQGGSGIVIERINFKGVNLFGGPVEKTGRLKYIDGCTDSLLLCPPYLGDPCLNALFFPPNINQTSHTHPSMRVGMVVSGRGECVTPWGNISLVPGMVFIIHEEAVERTFNGVTAIEGTHCFRTFEDQGMIVIAYHPDSDFGPLDENHPMLNRTIVDGVSAKNIDSIRTK